MTGCQFCTMAVRLGEIADLMHPDDRDLWYSKAIDTLFDQADRARRAHRQYGRKQRRHPARRRCRGGR
jgi:hypothetical protein